MNTKDFFYDLPQNLIAQTPIEPRDSSRLLALNRTDGTISHHIFYDIIDLLNEGDLLVINNSRVIPARIFGTKDDGNIIELLLLEQLDTMTFETLVKPGKRAKDGIILKFSDELYGTITKILENGNRIIEFSAKDKNIFAHLEKIGTMPLPPYIKEKLNDPERYQTVYSKPLGSAAAPTAGLHFTNELLSRIRQKGVNIAEVTLHVGLGTFRPVKVDNILEHEMHSEHYSLGKDAADLILNTKKAGGKIIAVGTTSCRVLESLKEIKEQSGSTDIFIYPSYKFKLVDKLITNFHLPESTLIMLVSAFAGYDNTIAAYKQAVDMKYRFFSFGDAMIIY